MNLEKVIMPLDKCERARRYSFIANVDLKIATLKEAGRQQGEQEDSKASKSSHKDTWGPHPTAAAHDMAWHGIANHNRNTVYLPPSPTPLLSPIYAINFPVHPPTNPMDGRTFLFLVFCDIFCKLFF
jgi:hypothetical protein